MRNKLAELRGLGVETPYKCKLQISIHELFDIIMIICDKNFRERFH